MLDIRENIMLNGEWDLAFDPGNIGKKRSWFKNFPKQTKKIRVPGVWEQLKPGYDGVGWYRKAVNIEAGWLKKVIRLEIGAAHYYADVYINGRLAGSHEGGYTPFIFDITRLVKKGDNNVIVRVINPPINYDIEGFRAGAPLNQGDLPTGKAGWYFNFGGIWQDVKLSITEKTYISDCFVEPFIRKKLARLNITVNNKGKAGNYRIACRVTAKKNPGEVAAEKNINIRLKTGENKITAFVDIKDMKLWSDITPFLYTAGVKLFKECELLDAYAVNFGMREFIIKNGNFLLNGKKIILKGFLQQGVYPRTLSYPYSREFAEKELRMCKDFGFNYLRMHIKTAPVISLELADEIGILLSEEPPSGWIGKSEHCVSRLKNEAREMLLRDRNHPSIIMWCMLNEIVNFRGYTIPEKLAMKAELAHYGRQFDPSRLLIDNAGEFPDKKHPHDMIMLPYSHKQVEMLNPVAYVPLPLEDASLVSYRNLGKKGKILFTHEFGAPEIAPDYKKVMSRYTRAERKLGLEDYKLHKDFYGSLKSYFNKAKLGAVFGSVEGLIKKSNEARAEEIKHIVAAMRSDPNRDGMALCQLADASGELFGAVDIWREPKATWFRMAKAARTPYLAPEIMPRVFPASGGTAVLRATLINENKLGIKYKFAVSIISKNGTTLKKFKGNVKAKAGVQTVLLKKIKLKLKEGQYFLVAELFEGSSQVSKDDMRFTVIKEAVLKAREVSLHDPEKTMTGYFQNKGVAVRNFGNNSRDKNMPLVLDFRKVINQGWYLNEVIGQLRKSIQLGGCAVLFEPDPVLMYEYLFPTLIRQEAGGMGRGIDYVKKHPVFAGLPCNTVMEYEYANVRSRFGKEAKGEDILKAGGEIVSGNMDSHMWTRPACYFWKVSTAVVPIGKGHVILCYLNVLGHLGKDAVADRLFVNLINYAKTLIKKGGEEKLLSRCIDPLAPADLK